MTYSIVARDPHSGALGVAVQSHFFGVGSVATWARAGVGVVATRGFAEPSYGPRGLDRMATGDDPAKVLEQLVAQDPGAAFRQVSMISSTGPIAVHTGGSCIEHAGHVIGLGVAAQGNMLEDPAVWPAMLDAFVHSDSRFAHRLLDALDAGEAAGGDIRGRQSATILVVAAEETAEPWQGVLVDVRVDDHPDPLTEIRRLLDIHIAYGRIFATARQPGLLLGDAAAVASDALEEAVASLTQAQEVLGENPEASFWLAVILARAGDIERARTCLASAAGVNPALVRFFRRLPASGMLPDDPALLDAVAPAGGPADA
ncbi:MAG: DUF1028 domain-containing protein [Acidimicrobiales bacterium]